MKSQARTAAVSHESQATLFPSTEYVIVKIQHKSIPSSKYENVKFGLFLEFSSKDDFKNFDRDLVIIVYNYTSYAMHPRVRIITLRVKALLFAFCY